MGGLYKDPTTGEDRYVYDDQTKEALAAGWTPVGESTVRGPDGEVKTLSPEQLTSYYSQYAPASLSGVSEGELSEFQRKRNLETVHGGSNALTALEGAGSALTFGGSDWLLDALGADTAKRAEANPYARATGEIGTTVATTTLTGGLGGAAKGLLGRGLTLSPLGALTSRTGKLANHLGGAKGLSAASTIEGIVTSGGGVVSNLALRDDEFSAEAALADIGLGGVIGGVAGGAAGLLFKGAAAAKGAAKRYGKGIDLEDVDTAGFDTAVKEANKQFSAAEASLGGGTGKVSRIADLPDDYWASGYTQRGVIQYIDDVSAETTDLAGTLGRGKREASDVLLARRKIDQLINPVGEGYGTGATKGRSKLFGPENPGPDGKASSRMTPEENVELKGLTQDYYDKVVTLGKKLDVADVEERLLKGVPGKNYKAGAAADQASYEVKLKEFQDAEDVYHAKLEEFDAELTAWEGAPRGKRGPKPSEPKKPRDLKEPRAPSAYPQGAYRAQGIQRAFDEAADLIPAEVKAGVAASRKALDAAGDVSLKALLKLPEEELLPKLTAIENHQANLIAMGKAAKIPGMVDVLDMQSSRVTGALEKLSGHGAQDIDRAYRQLLGSFGGPDAPKFKGTAADLHRAWLVNAARKDGGELWETLTKLDGTKQSLLGKALGQGARQALGYMGYGAGAALGGPLVGGVLGSAAQGLASTRTASKLLQQATGAALHALSAAAKGTAKAARQVGPNMGTIVRNTSLDGTEPPKNEKPRQTYDRLSGQLSKLLADPSTQEKLNESLGQVRTAHWGAGDKLEMKAMGALEFLFGEVPKDPGNLQRWGMSSWRPTDAEVHRWLSSVSAVVSPFTSLKRFMAGGGSPAEAKAIRAVYPKLFEKYQEHFLENLTENRELYSANTRTRLGILFDAPVDSRLRPEFRTYMKEHWTARAEEQKPLDVKAGMAPEEPSPAQKLLA